MGNRRKQIGWDRKSLMLDNTIGQEVVTAKHEAPHDTTTKLD